MFIYNSKKKIEVIWFSDFVKNLVLHRIVCRLIV
jgi:hypothetical protein